jgi:hypothetical protein
MTSFEEFLAFPLFQICFKEEYLRYIKYEFGYVVSHVIYIYFFVRSNEK